MPRNLVAVDLTSTKHDEFRKPPVTPIFQISMQKQLRRNLVYIEDAKNIVDEKAARGSLKPQEQIYLDHLYNTSLSGNQSLLSAAGSKEKMRDNLNLKKRAKVSQATEDAGIFGQAVWTTSERIRQEEEAIRRGAFMRREFSESTVSRNDHGQQWHQNMPNPAITDVRHSFGSYISPGPQRRLFVANPNSRNTSTAGSLLGSRLDCNLSPSSTGPSTGAICCHCANPNSRNTSTEASLPDVRHSSGLYIPPGPQEIPYVMSSSYRNISTEGIPPSSRMGSDLSLSQQTAMTGSFGSGYYPRSGSVNTASLEDDGTHFSMGSRVSGSSEMYQLDPSTGYYSGEPGSSRYPAMYNSGQEYYRNQTQMTGMECIITDQKILDAIMYNMMMLTSLVVTGVCILKQGLRDTEQYRR
ncbi:hypothetical protein C8R41DRAFT_900590 [Lentinula lateritia]|uniref:Uncharacterized protein n=1 Tax=Lentinula lateritia TaxID=40482 RepID=A0ABQ8VX76_9AGAR|nr:hypothetical protein C8R41DRAFT_900590 [Lentinula lateritia]